jgi:hypothetical protein
MDKKVRIDDVFKFMTQTRKKILLKIQTLTIELLFIDPQKVERVKDLYLDLQLPHTYEIYEEESYKIITTHIQQISRGLPHKIFFKILEKIYRRTH